MKFCLLIMLISVSQLFADAFGQNNRVSLKLENKSLVELMDVIQEKTDYSFIYSAKDIEKVKSVSIEVENALLKDVLDKVLEGTGIEYMFESNLIIFKKQLSAILQQKTRIIKGQVKDKDGNFLPGVSVVVKGTNSGVATDIDGKFEIKVDDKQGVVLLFSFVGMKTKEVAVAKKNELNVVLESNSEELQEVVITGYQTISKERATGSFSTITNEELDKKINSDLTKVIEGLTTGLVMDDDGNITIRGKSTFKAVAQPLIVLDGFPYGGDLKSINPDNIENITVLKDGVAASIYGARSANGVIVVTTKQGVKGDMTISYKGSFSTTQKSDFSDLNRSSTSEYIDGQIAQYDSYPQYYYPHLYYMSKVDYLLMQSGMDIITRDEAMSEIDKLRNIDAFKQVEKYGLRNRFSHQHSLTVSGGGEKNLYNASISFFDEKGEELMSENSRFIFDIKNIWKPNKNVSFTTSANIVYRKNKDSNTSMFDLAGKYGIQPYDAIVDENGRPKNIDHYVNPSKIEVYKKHKGMKPWGYSPLDDIKEGYNKRDDFQTRLSANLKVDIIKGLNLTVGGSWTRGSTNSQVFYSGKSHKMRIAFNDASSATDPNKHYLPEGAMIDENRNINESYTFRTQVNFNRSFNDDKHRVSALIGNEVRRDQFDNSILPTKLGYNPTSGDYKFIDNSTFHPFINPAGNDFMFGRRASLVPEVTTGGLNYRDNRYVSWYGNGSYEYDSRFIISGSIRFDLANFFGTDPKYRYKPLWSIGGTYKLSKEEWFKVDIIDRLNLRASYGINGNISMSEGPFLILSSSGYSQYSQAFVHSIKSPANRQLRWEKTTTTNLGFDLAMIENRLNLSVDMYEKKSTDLLSPDALDRTTGVSSISKNVGEITNKGIEVSLSVDVLSMGDLKYNTMLNISYNKSMVDKYNVNRPYASRYLETNSLNEEGYAIQSMWGYRQGPLTDEGDSQAYDVNGELTHPNSITKDDIIYMGTTIPKVNTSWTNRFSYKKIELSFMFVGSFGAKYWEDVFDGTNVQNRHVAEAWKKKGDEETTIYPKVTLWGAGRYFNKGDKFIKSADYVKLRELTLSYNLPHNWLKTIGFKKSKVFMQGRNLLTITRSGVDIDPETGGLPLKREFYAGLSFEF